MTSLRRFALLLAALTMLSVVGFAGDEDAPSRAVRLKYINGKVSIQPGGVDEWVEATVNRPLTSADRVWTDKDSRAELSLGTSFMRLNDETSLELSNVGDNTVQVQLYQGTLNLRVAHLYDGEIYEVDTPNLVFTVLKSGSYRFDVNSDLDTSVVTVWKGEGEATGDGPGVRIRSREQMRFSDSKSLVHTSLSPRYDGFDDWCRVRDERADRAGSLRYVVRGVIGYEDLDDYGSWVYISPYGWVWRPVVMAGWAPYRYGHWIWVSPWGWTWVDDAPWGFAPFHYGRWVYASHYWSWCPGPIVVRPYYAPALVAWIGGTHWGVGFGIGGGVGWFPLGWGEPYWPHYRYSRGYFRNVNISNTRITNITYITNNYYNRPDQYRHRWTHEGYGSTVVPRDTIMRGRPVGPNVVRASDRDLREARVMRDPAVTPSRDSRLGPHRDGPAATPPANIEARRARPGMPGGIEARDPHNRTMEGRNPNPPSRDARGPMGRVPDAREGDNRTPARGEPSIAERDHNRPDRSNDAMTSRRPVPRPPQRGGDNGEPAARGAAGARDSGRPDRPTDIAREVPRPPLHNGDANGPNDRASRPDGNDGDRGPRSVAGNNDRGSRPVAGDNDRSRAVPRPPRGGDDAPRPSAIESRRADPTPDVSPRENPRANLPRPDVNIDRPSRPAEAQPRTPREPRVNVPRPSGEVRPAPVPQAERRSPGPSRDMERPMPSRPSGGEPRASAPQRQVERPMPSRSSGGWGGGESRPSPRMSSPSGPSGGSRPASPSRQSAPSHSSGPSHDGGGARSSHGAKPQ